jgi:multimeric flavodoxin WrbA
MKKVLIISTSLRNGSNSELLAKEFEKGAKEAGNDVEFISLRGKNFTFCKGCFACQKRGRCVINDDANEIVDKMCESDVIVWATPIYYYEMSGQMKTLIDRANSLYARDYKFKDVYLLTVAQEDEKYTPEKAINGLQGWVDCFDGVELRNTLFAGGYNDPNEIKNSNKLKEAYELGRRL